MPASSAASTTARGRVEVEPRAEVVAAEADDGDVEAGVAERPLLHAPEYAARACRPRRYRPGVEPDDLYGLPLEEFTAARNALAKERPEAKGLRKPSIAAWAVNQLARRHRRELESFLDAAAKVRQAQLRGGDVRATTAAERTALRRLLQLAGEYAGAAQSDRIRQTLQAAAVDEDAAEQVRAGRLERELEPAGFGTLVAGGAAPARRTEPAPKRDRAAERAAVEAARTSSARRRPSRATTSPRTSSSMSASAVRASRSRTVPRLKSTLTAAPA